MPYVKGDKHKCFILGQETETFGKGTPLAILSPEAFYRELGLTEFFMSITSIEKSYKALCAYDATQNRNSFCGNPLVYCFYWEGLLATRYKGGKTLMETYATDPAKYWERVCKMDRRKGKPPSVRDAYELNKAITFFKPSTAKHLVQRFTEPGAVVFDPCAGWGGRILGTLSAGRRYVGCDTNPKVKVYADTMLSVLNIPEGQGTINTCSCLEWIPDYQYDFAFTSPPYSNLEVYEEMVEFVDDDDYFIGFLIPMINTCLNFVKDGCPVAINVSEKIYNTLVGKYEYPECVEKIDFLQQMGQQSGKKKDYVYIWR
tara:strand:- start:5330 stop:6274 length:945 start_codon:yes stop_codon:yes gene_type:complete